MLLIQAKGIFQVNSYIYFYTLLKKSVSLNNHFRVTAFRKSPSFYSGVLLEFKSTNPSELPSVVAVLAPISAVGCGYAASFAVSRSNKKDTRSEWDVCVCPLTVTGQILALGEQEI